MLEVMLTNILKKLDEPGLEIDPGVFQKLLAADGAALDQFGRSVAVSNTSVAVGAFNHLSKGGVYVY